MRIVHYIPTKFPVQGYGGIERVAYWLGKAQAEMGHQVTYLCNKSDELPFAKVIEAPEKFDDLTPFIPSGTDIVQLYDVFPLNKPNLLEELEIHSARISMPVFKLNYPCLVGLHGNGKKTEVFHPHSVFVSRDHANRHNWTEYVHNGIDISEYSLKPYKHSKDEFLLFLAKANWIVKNLPGAIRIANSANLPLHIGGGNAPFWCKGITSYGMIDGARKMHLLQTARALLFPIIWNEPFGIVTTEALACGTPVISTPRGALPEIIDSSCGVLADSFDDLVEAVRKIDYLEPEACRNRVLEKFTHIHMAEKYLMYYSKILKEGSLRAGYPESIGQPRKIIRYKQPFNNYISDLSSAVYMRILKK